MDNHNKYSDMYLWTQNSLDLSHFQNIYGNLASHLWKKFLNVERNILNFLTLLDEENKRLMFEWIDSNYVNNEFD